MIVLVLLIELTLLILFPEVEVRLFGGGMPAPLQFRPHGGAADLIPDSDHVLNRLLSDGQEVVEKWPLTKQ
jgi:hypothetical protein